MATARPRTGERRKIQQPLKIDKLPPSVHDAILYLRNTSNKTWEEIVDLSAQKYSPDWKTDGGGFVNWDDLPTSVLELFPLLALPRTNLHRWYDLRFAQVQRDVLARSAQARELAEAFSKSVVEGSNEAVLNAARDTFFSILGEDVSAGGRAKAAKALISLAEVMQSARANDIKERKVAVDERKLAQMEREAEARRRKMEAETERLSKKAAKGEVTPEDLDRLKMNVFGMAPKAANATKSEAA